MKPDLSPAEHTPESQRLFKRREKKVCGVIFKANKPHVLVCFWKGRHSTA